MYQKDSQNALDEMPPDLVEDNVAQQVGAAIEVGMMDIDDVFQKRHFLPSGNLDSEARQVAMSDREAT